MLLTDTHIHTYTKCAHTLSENAKARSSQAPLLNKHGGGQSVKEPVHLNYNKNIFSCFLLWSLAMKIVSVLKYKTRRFLPPVQCNGGKSNFICDPLSIEKLHLRHLLETDSFTTSCVDYPGHTVVSGVGLGIEPLYFLQPKVFKTTLMEKCQVSKVGTKCWTDS